MRYSPYSLVNESIVKTLKEFNEEFNKINDGTLKCILFGSCARGRANGNSDVDIAVVSEGPIAREKCYDIRGLEELGRPPVQTTIIPENRLYTENMDLYENIKREGVEWQKVLMDILP